MKKGSGSEDVTLSEVNLLLSKDPLIKINKIFDNGNNFKIVSHDTVSSNRVKNYLEKKVGLEVFEKALYGPFVLISGLPKSLNDDFLLQELAFRNGAPKSVTKIIRKFGPNASKFHSVIIRRSVSFGETVLRSGRVFLGASSFRVEDYINVLKCFRFSVMVMCT